MKDIYCTFGIYRITNIISGKSYIGKTGMNFGDRWDSHRALLRSNHHDNPHLQNAWDKYGESNFEFAVVEMVSDTSLLNELEIQYIKQYKEASLSYNIHNGGDGGLNLGKHLSDETKRKIGEKNRANMTGRKLSKETRKKMSEAQKRRQYSQSELEWRREFSRQLNTGRIRSEETKEKLRKINQNYAIPPFAGILREIYDIEDYKQLKLTKTELENYAMLVMKLGINSDGEWEMDLDKAKEFWRNLDGILPEEIGSVLSPMAIDKISFEKSNTGDTNTVSEAEQNLFSAAGVSSLLFNNAKASANALQLSIKADQAMTFGIVKSIEGVLNRFVRAQSYGKNFKITFLDCSPFNRKECGDAYLKACQLGIPMVSYYCASQGLGQDEMDCMNFLEDEAFFANNWFLIDDPEVLEYLGVAQYYKFALDFNSFDDLFTKAPSEIKDTINHLSVGQKKSVAYRANALAKSNMLENFPTELKRERVCIYDNQRNQFMSVFYHLRNAFAHCRLNMVDVNGECVFILEDVQYKQNFNQFKVSARMILRKSTLLNWINLIEDGEREDPEYRG